MVSLFGWNISRKPPHNYLTEDARALGREYARDSLQMKAEKRRTEHEIELLKMQIAKLELETQKRELLDELQGDEQEGLNPDALIGQILQRAMSKIQSPTEPTAYPAYAVGSQSKKTLSQNELIELKERIPASMLKQAEGKTKEQILDMIRLNYPDAFAVIAQYDDDTIDRAFNLLKAKTI